MRDRCGDANREKNLPGFKMLGRLVVGKIVEQNGAQNRALRFYVGGQAVRETVVGGGQGYLKISAVKNVS